jgi:geranylgeranyl diphosphate synthase type II
MLRSLIESEPIKERLSAIEKALDEVLPSPAERPVALHEAMRYAVGAGGKRIRPLVCLLSAEAVGGDYRDAIEPACAIELLHNYTLVHDDLPAMDNDCMRRGKPTVWKKYGEALAILTGDALLSLSYKVAGLSKVNTSSIVSVLGDKGMGVVRGQVEDVALLRDADFIYTHKTADLFIASALMGGYAAGATEKEIEALGVFSLNLGLQFQYEDDLLDGDGLYSREETLRRISESTDSSLRALSNLKGNVSLLRDLTLALVSRTV